MKWFKHDSSAHTDAKIQKVIMKYRAEGYALYWYALELIAGKVDKNNITFELEHDAEIIGFQLGIDQMRVQEIMHYMVDLGLFDISKNNQIRCLKMAYRLDETTSKNPEFKELLTRLKSEGSPESIGKHSGDIPESIGKHSDQTRLDQTRLNKDPFVEEKPPTKKKYNFSDEHMKFADYMHSKILDVMPRARKPNFEKWAHEIRLAAKALDVSLTDLWHVFLWANADPFWKTNILSPAKLREKFPQLEVKRNEAIKRNGGQGTPPAAQPSTAGDRVRARLRSEGHDV